MSDGNLPRIEKMLDVSARFLGPRSVHPAELAQRVLREVEASLQDRTVANRATARLNPGDLAALGDATADVRQLVLELVVETARARGWRTVGDFEFALAPDDGVRPGTVEVDVGFADTLHRSPGAPVGSTRSIARQRNLLLRFEDGSATPLAYTPFRLGRGPGNDLVLPFPSVSRDHAVIVETPLGLEIRDLGGRNGVIVGQQKCVAAALEPGVVVQLGDVRFWLEEE